MKRDHGIRMGKREIQKALRLQRAAARAHPGNVGRKERIPSKVGA